MKREISTAQREIQDTETVLWAGCVGLCRIISDGSSDSLFAVALAEVNLVRPVSVSANARTDAQQVLADCQCPYQIRCRSGQVFHLVSACFTWFHLLGKKIGAGRLKTYVFSYKRTHSRSLQTANTLPRPFHLREWSAGDFHAFRFTLFHLVALTPR